ncbi:MAG: 1-acyl-sn-glycerol-3-phosphate acyltransferase [Legionellales bacterium]|jgi:1-acyl-sn-glycerol-3-phosphate acyltransferase|nr:1-acyl-sn-glycerol-3-phosphate acyltransferase [Legionellales bacterium]|tara:strand:+ start:234 stop:941 length:708 start_codon:yes stop_codon:yes gene_type:complete
MLFLRSLLFYIGQIISTILIAPVGVIAFPLDFKKRYYLITRWAVFNLWWLKICCNVTYEILGKENIPKKPCIVMCKHQSAFETLALQRIFIPQVWILKKELLQIPIYGWGLASMQPIAINRDSSIKSFKQIADQGCERLEKGYWVIIFPEGTRVAPNKKKKYLPGGGMLAEKSGARIVPVAHNAGRLWPRNSMIKKPGLITIKIGPVMESKNKTAKEITNNVENWIEKTVGELPS